MTRSPSPLTRYLAPTWELQPFQAFKWGDKWLAETNSTSRKIDWPWVMYVMLLWFHRHGLHVLTSTVFVKFKRCMRAAAEPDDVVLHTAIHCQDMNLSFRRFHRHEDFLLLPWDFCYQVPVVRVINFQVCWRCAPLHYQFPQHWATFADHFGDGTGIHSIDTRDALRGQPLTETADAAVVRWFIGVVGNDHALQMDPELCTCIMFDTSNLQMLN